MSKPTEQELCQLLETLGDMADEVYGSLDRDLYSQYDALLGTTISDAKDACKRWKDARDDKYPAVKPAEFGTAPGNKMIAHTPIIKPEGCVAGCIVIRETDTQFIVHNAEVDADGKFVGYYWGHYFNKNEPDALKRAMQKFVEKTIRWHFLREIHA